MDRSRDLLSPEVLLASWLAAAVALPGCLVLGAVGQAAGALLGGCHWIGISLPPHRQVWALVNQPQLDFAARNAALGYWLGSSLVLLLVAALLVRVCPRPRSMAGELLVVQLAWAAAAVGLAWLPLLDLNDGHLARWLYLRRLPAGLLVVAPLLATVTSITASLQLLALLGIARRHAGRLARLTAVVLHLGLPLLGWAALVCFLRGSLPRAPAVALACPLLLALTLAVVGAPRPFLFAIEPLRVGSALRLLAAASLLAGLVLGLGRPLPGDRVAGLLWRTPSASNNVRPWIEPTRLPWVRGIETPSATP